MITLQLDGALIGSYCSWITPLTVSDCSWLHPNMARLEFEPSLMGSYESWIHPY